LYTIIIVYKKKKSKRLKPNKWLKSLALQNFLTKYTIKTREFRKQGAP
jgi:DNA polymerase III delta subunit